MNSASAHGRFVLPGVILIILYLHLSSLSHCCCSLIPVLLLFHALSAWVQELEENLDSRLPLVDGKFISGDTVSSWSSVQSRCCCQKMLIICYSWTMLTSSCSHPANSYPVNVVNQLEVLVPLRVLTLTLV